MRPIRTSHVFACQGDATMLLRHIYAQTDFGPILASFTCNGVCSIEFGGSKDALIQSLTDRFPAADIRSGEKELRAEIGEIVQYINDPSKELRMSIDSVGTAFQQHVWEVLRTIPVGQTRTYSEVAQDMGMPEAFRAVASACGRNRLAVIIPCHRVMRKDGGLGGYHWGIERKQALLEREKQIMGYTK